MNDDTAPVTQIDAKSLEIDPEIQKMLNQPLVGDEMDPADSEFLAQIMAKVDDGTIHLFVPSSLVNHAVYDKLPPESQALADVNSFNFLSEIRNIKNLSDAQMMNTYQMKYMVRHLRLIKERVEQLGGDIFII